MSIFDEADKVARWNQQIMVAAGGLALNYWIDKGIVKVVAKRVGPIATGIAIWHVVNWIGLSASAAIDPERGSVNWANYIASPLSKLSPGKDSIIGHSLNAIPTSPQSFELAKQFARSSSPGGPWFRTIMGAYGADVF